MTELDCKILVCCGKKILLSKTVLKVINIYIFHICK